MVIDPLNSTRNNIIKWIKTILNSHGIKLKKKLSQIILIEPKAYKTIINSITNCLTDNQHAAVLEIGCGLGTLTFSLAKTQNMYVIGVEIDKRFTPILRKLQSIFPNLDIVIGDGRKILNSIRSVNTVVGNLPYHITSDILIAMSKTNIQCALITIQKDVANRLMTRPGSRNYGKISLYTQYLFDIKLVDVLPPNFFFPPPEVFSAIILLKRKKLYTSYAYVEPLIKCLFSYKRKNLLKSLKKCLNKNYKDCINSINLSEEIWRKRVFQLAPEDIDTLVILLKKNCLEMK